MGRHTTEQHQEPSDEEAGWEQIEIPSHMLDSMWEKEARGTKEKPMTNLKEEIHAEYNKRFPMHVEAYTFSGKRAKKFIDWAIDRTRTATLESVREAIKFHPYDELSNDRAFSMGYARARKDLVEVVTALQTLPTEDSNEMV